MTFPIYLKKKEEVEVDAEEAAADDEADEDLKMDDDDEEDKKEQKEKTKQYQFTWEHVNNQQPIWMRPKEDITDAEYKEFYKTLTGDREDPLAYTHFSAEGEIEFNSIVYIPAKIPSAMKHNFNTKKTDIKLYVRHVMISDDIPDLLPKYLNFAQGVVDSNDLPLNVSREQLQQNKVMKIVTKKLTRKILELLKKLAKEGGDEDEGEEEDKEKKKAKEEQKETAEQYLKIFKEYESVLKHGCLDDSANRSKLAKLFRFRSTKSDELISLDTYVKNMKEGQEKIYFLQGDLNQDSEAAIELMKKKPNFEVFSAKDIEVLYLLDKYDEICFDRLSDYDGKKLQSIAKQTTGLDETDAEAKKNKKIEEMFKPLADACVEVLKKESTTANACKVSKRLVSSPVVVVAPDHGYTPQMELIYSSGLSNSRFEPSKRVLEFNVRHPIIQKLNEKLKENKDDETARANILMLYTVAAYQAGYDVSETNINEMFANTMYSMTSKELGVDFDAEIKDIEVPEEESTEEEEEEKKEDKKEDDDEEEEEKAEKHEEL